MAEDGFVADDRAVVDGEIMLDDRREADGDSDVGEDDSSEITDEDDVEAEEESKVAEENVRVVADGVGELDSAVIDEEEGGRPPHVSPQLLDGHAPFGSTTQYSSGAIKQ